MKTLKCLSIVLSLSLLTSAPAFAAGSVQILCKNGQRSSTEAVELTGVRPYEANVMFAANFFDSKTKSFKNLKELNLGVDQCDITVGKQPLKVSCLSNGAAREMVVKGITLYPTIAKADGSTLFLVGSFEKSLRSADEKDLGDLVGTSTCTITPL